ncbi:DUF4124 domain-containing protein [Acinetobacter rathckeae]|uniref:DUF4124 domain-containing protein n=1 Tax=Acinetobacter rathckeae TaxID=2605272 RepID=UPI0018A251A6|nr:DUF4124 domain-containing protein [Acinetobacter rathckeae]MBF7687824.1 DUF4124 domain-containing protein [Acinetobacter rathckeae]MBF7687953.1 DUF4124 domain-containing protein [Acinetobacter rathckeae]MBF7695994.1 DUF4124 domain-containing protein [Acinetobacter rathckeae]
MTNPKKLYSALLTLLLTTTAYAQDIYKWIDANGTTHYSQTPPQNAKKTTIFKTYGQTTSSASSALPPDQNPPRPIAETISNNSATTPNAIAGSNSSEKLPQ